jgi:hypothetical protein
MAWKGCLTPMRAAKTSRCVLAHVRLAQERGATVLDQTPVLKITPSDWGGGANGDGDLYVRSHRPHCRQLGQRRLAEQGIDLPLKIMPCQLGFYQPKDPADLNRASSRVLCPYERRLWRNALRHSPRRPQHRRQNHDLLRVGYRRKPQRRGLHPQSSLDGTHS